MPPPSSPPSTMSANPDVVPSVLMCYNILELACVFCSAQPRHFSCGLLRPNREMRYWCQTMVMHGMTFSERSYCCRRAEQNRADMLPNNRRRRSIERQTTAVQAKHSTVLSTSRRHVTWVGVVRAIYGCDLWATYSLRCARLEPRGTHLHFTCTL